MKTSQVRCCAIHNHTFQVLQSGTTARRLLLSGTLAHFPVLERRRDPTPGSFFCVFKSAFAFCTSFLDSRTTSASFAFTRLLISRSSPVLGINDLACSLLDALRLPQYFVLQLDPAVTLGFKTRLRELADSRINEAIEPLPQGFWAVVR